MDLPEIIQKYLGEYQQIDIGYFKLYESLHALLEETKTDIAKYVLITDETVSQLCLKTKKIPLFEYIFQYFVRWIKNKELAENFFNDDLKDADRTNPKVAKLILSSEYGCKSRESKEQLENFLFENYCHRDTLLISIGGGSVSDLVGYTASTYYRGIPWIAIPTTLLSMVDGSVGGKTGIDLPNYGKNLLGSFWPPKKIIIDFLWLDLLQCDDLWRQGWAEIIKLTIVFDRNRFEQLENLIDKKSNWAKKWTSCIHQYSGKSTKDVVKLNHSIDIVDWILWGIKTKMDIVRDDLRESKSGKRVLVNFGHTMGHALENLSFKLAHQRKSIKALSHGNAVGFGMIKEIEIALHEEKISQPEAFRIIWLLNEFGWDSTTTINYLFSEKKLLFDFLKRDKKAYADCFNMILIKTIGTPYKPYLNAVSFSSVEHVLTSSIQLRMSSTITTHTSLNPIRIHIPASKSITNRAIFIASLYLKKSKHPSICLKNILHSEDTYLMLNALKKFSACKFDWNENSTALTISSGDGLDMTTCYMKDPLTIHVGNAGTVARFIIPLCLLLKSTHYKCVILSGAERMSQRPFKQIIDAFQGFSHCIEFIYDGGHNDDAIDNGNPMETPFLKITPIPSHHLHSGHVIQISPIGSSQFISGLLMTLPLFPQNTTIKVLHVQKLTDIPSYPFILMTIKMMKQLVGIEFDIENDDDDGSKSLLISLKDSKKHEPVLLEEYTIEPDITAATYPLAFAVLTNSCIEIPFIMEDSIQGDKEFIGILEKIGCKATYTSNALLFEGSFKYEAWDNELQFNFENIGDTFMTMCIISIRCLSFCKKITLSGLKHQNVKECDRVSVIYNILKQCGVHIFVSDDHDKLIFEQFEEDTLRPSSIDPMVIVIDPVHDHRIAMSLALLPAVDKRFESIIIKGKNCTVKTWPDYWIVMKNAFNWIIHPL